MKEPKDYFEELGFKEVDYKKGYVRFSKIEDMKIPEVLKRDGVIDLKMYTHVTYNIECNTVRVSKYSEAMRKIGKNIGSFTAEIDKDLAKAISSLYK